MSGQSNFLDDGSLIFKMGKIFKQVSLKIAFHLPINKWKVTQTHQLSDKAMLTKQWDATTASNMVKT